MTDEEHVRLVIRVAALCAMVAFYPQIMKLMRSIGYREESEVDTTGWKRGLALLGLTIIGLVFLLVMFG